MVTAMNSGRLPTRADFHEAISRRSPRWYAACLKITRNAELAEDAVQEALLAAWQKRHQFQHDARLDTWIHRIAINAALQLLRKQRPGVFEPLHEDPADVSAGPEQAHHDGELAGQLSGAVAKLSETERVCFVLKHLEEWRLREIAEALQMEISAVKQAVFRAVKKLRVGMRCLQEETT